MSKAIKFKNNMYLDTRGAVHNGTILKTYLDNEKTYLDNQQNIIDYNSKALNGYLKLLNGIIIQWGRFSMNINANETTQAVNFNIPFPNNCLSMSINLNDVGYGIQGFTTGVGLPSIGKTSFTVNVKCKDRYSPTNTITLYWIAIGY